MPQLDLDDLRHDLETVIDLAPMMHDLRDAPYREPRQYGDPEVEVTEKSVKRSDPTGRAALSNDQATRWVQGLARVAQELLVLANIARAVRGEPIDVCPATDCKQIITEADKEKGRTRVVCRKRWHNACYVRTQRRKKAT